MHKILDRLDEKLDDFDLDIVNFPFLDGEGFPLNLIRGVHFITY